MNMGNHAWDANNIQLQCPPMNFYRKSFEFNGVTYVTNFPGLSSQSAATREMFKQALQEYLLKSE